MERDREQEKVKARNRRLHNQRMFRKAVRMQLECWFGGENPDIEEVKERAKKLRDDMKKCSCMMCGNFRRHFDKVTIQEKKHLDQMNDEIKELDSSE